MGALTSKTKAFQARNWELKEYQTISLSDPFFSPIKVDVRDRKILRILPVIGTEEWINDNTRFFVTTNNPTPYILSFSTTKTYKLDGVQISSTQKTHEKSDSKEIATTTAMWSKKRRNHIWIVDETTDVGTLSAIKKGIAKKIKTTVTASTLHTPHTNNPLALNLHHTGAILIKENNIYNEALDTQLINHHRSNLEQISPTLVSLHETLATIEGTTSPSVQNTILPLPSIARQIPKFLHTLFISKTNQALSLPNPTFSQTHARAATLISLDPHISYNPRTQRRSKLITCNPSSPNKHAVISANNSPLHGGTYVNLYGQLITAPSLKNNSKIIKLIHHTLTNETI